MSRHHRTGETSQRDQRLIERERIAKQLLSKMEKKADKYISESATVLTFCIQYMLDTMEDLHDKLNGENCEFTLKARNKAMRTIKACEDFLSTFEPLILPEFKETWAKDYDRYRIVMDGWFNKTDRSYQMFTNNERANEICRAGALRYHDPYETNTQRCFELGFREGACYADMHPIGTIKLDTDEGEKEIEIKDIVRFYMEQKFPKSYTANLEINIKKPDGETI